MTLAGTPTDDRLNQRTAWTRALTLPLAALAALTAAFLLTGAAGPVPLEVPSAEAASKCAGAKKRPARLGKQRAAAIVKCLVNQKRQQKGVGKVSFRRSVKRAAGRHTKKMKKTDCFAHDCPGEPALSGRLERSGYLPCGCSWSAGENIAYGRGSRGTPKRIVRGWLRSPSHRHVMLSPRFDHIGVAMRRGTPFKSRRNAATYTLDFGAKK